eukprot:gene20584-biopygen13111
MRLAHSPVLWDQPPLQANKMFSGHLAKDLNTVPPFVHVGCCEGWRGERGCRWRGEAWRRARRSNEQDARWKASLQAAR